MQNTQERTTVYAQKVGKKIPAFENKFRAGVKQLLAEQATKKAVPNDYPRPSEQSKLPAFFNEWRR